MEREVYGSISIPTKPQVHKPSMMQKMLGDDLKKDLNIKV
jgi:hypothetical protein